MERDNISPTSNENPLIFIQSNTPQSVVGPMSIKAQSKIPLWINEEAEPNMLGSTRSHEMSLLSFLVEFDIITMIIKYILLTTLK